MLAAVVGSVVAGAISFIVNLFSLGAQYKLNEWNRKSIQRDQWRRDIKSTVNEFRREALRMSGRPEDLEFSVFENLIDEIEKSKDKTPPRYQTDRLDSVLSNLILHHRDYDPSSNGSQLAQYRAQMIEDTEVILRELDELSENPGFLS